MQNQSAKHHVSILVVEDEALLRFSIGDELRDLGYLVHEAANADHAIRILEQHPDIEVLFTDIDMPGSMDGLRLSAAVRDRWPPVKIIITSGKQRPSAAAMPGGSLFLSKPYAVDEVAAGVGSLMG